jgi:hypothetical protein
MKLAGQTQRLPARPLGGNQGIAASHAGNGRVFGISTAQFRVVGDTVVALAIIFPSRLHPETGSITPIIPGSFMPIGDTRPLRFLFLKAGHFWTCGIEEQALPGRD